MINQQRYITMKTKIIISLIGITALMFTACTNEEASVINHAATALPELNKIVTYTPREADYVAGNYPAYKKVQYFENGHITADTLFNYQHQAEEIITHTYSNNMYTQSFEQYGVTNRIIERTYDDTGRMVKKKTSSPNTYNNGTPIRISLFDYTTGNTVAISNYDGTTGEVLSPGITYNLTDNGFISGYELSDNIMYDTVIYDGDKPLSALNYSETVTFTYYDIEVPQNMRKTVAETNNAIMDGTGFDDYAALNCNYFLKSYDGHANFETTFNTLNYPIYTKGSGSLHQAPYEAETFYFYNN